MKKNAAKILLWQAGLSYTEAKRLYDVTATQIKNDSLTDYQKTEIYKHMERNHD